MPRPTAVRPATSSPGSCSANIDSSNKYLSSVFGMHGATDVDGGENGEDEGLEDGDEDLEAGQGDEQAAGEHRSHHRGLEEGGADDGEADEEQVAGQHVGEESHGQRQGPHEDGGHELDGRDEDVEGLGYSRREE